MFEKLLNAKIVKLQSQITSRYGENVAVKVIRDLDKKARATKNLSVFDNVDIQKYL